MEIFKQKGKISSTASPGEGGRMKCPYCGTGYLKWDDDDLECDTCERRWELYV